MDPLTDTRRVRWPSSPTSDGAERGSDAAVDRRSGVRAPSDRSERPARRRRRRRHGGVAALALVTLLVAGACGDGSGGGQATGDGGDAATTVVPSTSAPDGAGRPACSAAGLDPTPPAQPELPAEVADVRRRIVEAATACDFERLGRIASEGTSGFTASFGNGGDPAEQWRRLEQAGEEPLRYLVELLSLPHRGVTGADPAVFAWPSAFAFEGWDAVPQAARDALRPLYGDSDLESFEEAGSYLGYRVGLREDGEWMYFVAGD